ncbi:NAD(P)H-hydrate dehydratase [Candidatus Woesearchaeota archaeon]|nr:NAD(P)H-hydrate dehydratase [Candidatus Woesearchaeota archaeon]
MSDKMHKQVGISDVKSVLHPRNINAKKGDAGRVLIIGGSKDYIGAVALAGLAAFRSGVDSVVIAAPEKAAYAINALSADLVTKKISGEYFAEKHVKEVIKLADNADVVLIGNGLGRNKKTEKFVRKLVSVLEKNKKPYVLDADAIKAVSLNECKNAILTPHAKELEIFLSNSKLNIINKIKDIDTKIKEIQKHLTNNIILLKGRIDYIFLKDRVKLNKTGNPGMAKAGTGDVLAGLVAGFLAQSKIRDGKDKFDIKKDDNNSAKFNSACAAAFINGMLGDRLLAQRSGRIALKAGVYSYIASDLLKDIRNTLADIKKN